MINRRETKQRRLVLEAVQSRCDHPTAEQIYEDVHALDPKISHGTVYRNLNCLSEDGVICHVRVPGADRYDLRTDRHYHMFCIKCKKVIDAPYPYKAYLDEEIAEQSGYKIIRHRLFFEGICPECQNDRPALVPETVPVCYPRVYAPAVPVPAFSAEQNVKENTAQVQKPRHNGHRR